MLEGEVGGSPPGNAGVVEGCPGLAEVRVEVFHVFGHVVVDAEVGGAELGEGMFL